jgi:LysR family transcriptional regulator, glycine cleavage system transcriptional activator
MNQPRHRPLNLDSLRTFEAVARRLSFSAAAEELHLTQPAVSRQIKALEDELGAALFNRGTRRVELSAAGHALRPTVTAALEQLDRTVREIRSRGGRAQVSLSTFASFASLWLMPRLAVFQKTHPDFDIRLSANDRFADLDDPELDLLLRYCLPADAPAVAEPLFGELLTPVASARLLEHSRTGQAPPLRQAADLAAHALLEEDAPSSNLSHGLGWRRWLAEQGLPSLEPRRWLFLNFTHQQVQGALAGQGVALARMALVHDLLERGELVELFDGRCRMRAPGCYFLVVLPAARQRAELLEVAGWIRHEAARTRTALGHAASLAAP